MTLTRKRGAEYYESLCDLLPEGSQGFSADLDTDDNVLLLSGDEGFLFEKDSNGVYSGHFFLRSTKGSGAVVLCHQALDMMFNTYNAKVIKGLTPVGLKPALHMAARLGFKDYGEIETLAGPMRLSVLTKKEYTE